MKYMPKIIEFLGYFPFEINTRTIGGQIKKYRYLNGLSQDQLAYLLGVNESTIFHFENNKHKPKKGTLTKLKSLTIIS